MDYEVEGKLVRLEVLLREVEEELGERIDDLEKDTASRFWFYGPGPFGGVLPNVLPWIGSDGNDTWWRRTLVIPFFGLGALVIGLRWRAAEELWDEG